MKKLLVLCLLFSISSYANFTENRIETKFKGADVNNDGKLSLEEAKIGMSKVSENFTKIDTNNDGYVSIEEIIAAYEKNE